MSTVKRRGFKRGNNFMLMLLVFKKMITHAFPDDIRPDADPNPDLLCIYCTFTGSVWQISYY
jgi:hypothetical protein